MVVVFVVVVVVVVVTDDTKAVVVVDTVDTADIIMEIAGMVKDKQGTPGAVAKADSASWVPLVPLQLPRLIGSSLA